jgi:hypothetical protein
MDKAKIFWSWFERNSSKYYDLNTLENLDEKEHLLDELLHQLHKYSNGLYFEIGGMPNEVQELVITAAGNSDFFSKVDELVEKAPQINGWSIIDFKPAMGVDFVTEYEGIKFDPSQIWFLPLDRDNDPKSLGLRICFPNQTIASDEALINASYQMIDTILGEKSAALDINHIEVGKLPKDPADNGMIELSELPEYITWRKGQV